MNSDMRQFVNKVVFDRYTVTDTVIMKYGKLVL